MLCLLFHLYLHDFSFECACLHVLDFLQLMPGQAFQSAGIVSPPTPALDFLGPEMADLQQLLATMTKGKRGNRQYANNKLKPTVSNQALAAYKLHCFPY